MGTYDLAYHDHGSAGNQDLYDLQYDEGAKGSCALQLQAPLQMAPLAQAAPQGGSVLRMPGAWAAPGVAMAELGARVPGIRDLRAPPPATARPNPSSRAGDTRRLARRANRYELGLGVGSAGCDESAVGLLTGTSDTGL